MGTDGNLDFSYVQGQTRQSTATIRDIADTDGLSTRVFRDERSLRSFSLHPAYPNRSVCVLFDLYRETLSVIRPT